MTFDVSGGIMGSLCGVLAPGKPVASLIASMLMATNHRGEEAAAVAVSGGVRIEAISAEGRVSQALPQRKLGGLTGDLAIGNAGFLSSNRFGRGSNYTEDTAQPLHIQRGPLEFALALNGSLLTVSPQQQIAGVNDAEEDEELTGGQLEVTDYFARLMETSQVEDFFTQISLEGKRDSSIAADVIQGYLNQGKMDFTAAMLRALRHFEGAYSLLVMDEWQLIGIRDPDGPLPLCLGRLANDAGWALASESKALDAIGAELEREVPAGHIVIITKPGDSGVMEFPFDPRPAKTRPCVLEFVNFAAADSVVGGMTIGPARERVGETVAKLLPPPEGVDCVVPVPETGLGFAEGYSRHCRLPLESGAIQKNRYSGKTSEVAGQYNVIRDFVAGKRVLVVDDSVATGETLKLLIKLLFAAGAKEIHVRLVSPPRLWPCLFGMEDTYNRSELLAPKYLARDGSVDKAAITSYLDCDSFDYPAIDRLKRALGSPEADYCDACITGQYRKSPEVLDLLRYKFEESNAGVR